MTSKKGENLIEKMKIIIPEIISFTIVTKQYYIMFVKV